MDKTNKSKDYAKYFDFSDAKLLGVEEDGTRRYRIKGREISILSQPDYRAGKKRSKAESAVIEAGIPEDMRDFGKRGGQKHYLVQTYGCQMNEHDSEMIKGMLEQMGFLPTEDKRPADVILLNTCAIRENAEDRVFG